MAHNRVPDTPYGFTLSVPKREPVVKDYPETENDPDPTETVSWEQIEDEEDISDIHDHDDGMKELIANPFTV